MELIGGLVLLVFLYLLFKGVLVAGQLGCGCLITLLIGLGFIAVLAQMIGGV